MEVPAAMCRQPCLLSPDGMSMLAPLQPRPRVARQGGAAGLDPRLCQPAIGRRAIRRAGAVRQDRRRALRKAADRSVWIHEFGLAAARGLGGVRPVHDRLQRLGRAACRPAGAPPAPGGADELFRAHHAIAADLPHRHPFRPPDEGDAERHRRACGGCGSDSSASISPRSCRWSCCCRSRSTSTGGWRSCCSCCAWCSRC